MNIPETVGNIRVGLYWKAVKETTPKPCILYIINLLLYIISWKVRLTIWGTSMHTCWVQEKSYKPACHQFFQDVAEETLNATYQSDSKGVLF